MAGGRGRRSPGWELLVGASLAYLGVQLRQTVKNRNAWPFCAYNMFNYYLPDRFPQLRVVLITDRGELVGPADPWPLVPVEFFRVISILERIFFKNEDHQVRDAFCRTALDRLNKAPWPDWDEIRAAFRAPAGQYFTGMELHLVQVDFTLCDPNDRSHVLSAELLHRYDPTDLFARTGARPRWRYVDAGSATALPQTATRSEVEP